MKLSTNYVCKEMTRGSPNCVVVKVLDFDIVVCEFELQLRYHALFWNNIHEKDMNSPAMN